MRCSKGAPWQRRNFYLAQKEVQLPYKMTNKTCSISEAQLPSKTAKDTGLWDRPMIESLTITSKAFEVEFYHSSVLNVEHELVRLLWLFSILSHVNHNGMYNNGNIFYRTCTTTACSIMEIYDLTSNFSTPSWL